MVAVVVLAAALVGAQSTAAQDASSLALVTTYADGTTQFDLLSSRSAWKWTPKFPIIEGAFGVPSALKLTRQLDGETVRVTVSVLYFGRRGLDQQPEVTVASVIVPREGSIRIDAVSRYGIQPIRLSVATLTTTVPFTPSAFSDIPELEVSDVEVLTTPYPGYRITVRNLSEKAASSFGIQSYRGDAKALSGLRSGTAGRPVLLPMDSYSFDLNLTGGDARGPTPLDVIEITSVLWADGSSAGAPMTAAAHGVPTDAGRRVLLEQAITILRAALDAPDLSLDNIVSQLNAIPERDETLLPEAQRSRAQAKRMIVDDIQQLRQRMSAADVAALRAAVENLIGRYQNIIARLSPL